MYHDFSVGYVFESIHNTMSENRGRQEVGRRFLQFARPVLSARVHLTRVPA